MPLDIPAVLIALTQAYLVLGLCVAVSFLVLGIEAIDSAAEGSYVFRVLLLPGLVVLWPLVILRWAQVLQPLEPRSNRSHMQRHAVIWMFLTLFIPVILILAANERAAPLPQPSSERVSSAQVRP